MPYKIVMLMNGQSAASGSIPNISPGGVSHTYGFSEGFWDARDDVGLIRTFLLNTVGPLRAQVLPTTSRVIGFRLYQGGTGKALVVPCNFPGTAGPTDQANMAILAVTQSPTAYRQRRWWIHNVPDGYVVNGEFQPSMFYGAALQLYFTGLCQFAYFRGLAPANYTAILNISGTGLVTFAAPNPFVVGNIIQIRRTFAADHRRRGGTFTVASIGPLPNQLQLSGYNLGPTTGGNAYSTAYLLRSMGGPGAFPIIERAGTRRVGRPFDLYRGRKSAKAPSL